MSTHFRFQFPPPFCSCSFPAHLYTTPIYYSSFQILFHYPNMSPIEPLRPYVTSIESFFSSLLASFKSSCLSVHLLKISAFFSGPFPAPFQLLLPASFLLLGLLSSFVSGCIPADLWLLSGLLSQLVFCCVFRPFPADFRFHVEHLFLPHFRAFGAFVPARFDFICGAEACTS